LIASDLSAVRVLRCIAVCGEEGGGNIRLVLSWEIYRPGRKKGEAGELQDNG